MQWGKAWNFSVLQVSCLFLFVSTVESNLDKKFDTEISRSCMRKLFTTGTILYPSIKLLLLINLYTLLTARIIMDRDHGNSRGFGFVTYASSEEASTAIQAFDGQVLMVF